MEKPRSLDLKKDMPEGITIFTETHCEFLLCMGNLDKCRQEVNPTDSRKSTISLS
jgi:hypothetical protein